MTNLTARERDRQHGEVRRILLFSRAANRLRELTTKHRLHFKVEYEPARVQSPNQHQRVMAGMKLVESVDPLVIENLATRVRPFMLPKEACYFPYIVKALPKHVRIEGGPMTFDELAAKWEATLSATTAPLPVGMKLTNLVPGYVGELTSEGRMELMVDYELLTGQEVIELLLYGELVHIDRQKEKKLLRIRESEMASGFQLAVIAVAAALGKLIDILRLYADGFIKQLPADLIADIENSVP